VQPPPDQVPRHQGGLAEGPVLVVGPTLGTVADVRAGNLGQQRCQLTLSLSYERLLGCLADLWPPLGAFGGTARGIEVLGSGSR
jgi:hypothetical protein